jgi:hypothetical protein
LLYFQWFAHLYLDVFLPTFLIDFILFLQNCLSAIQSRKSCSVDSPER